MYSRSSSKVFLKLTIHKWLLSTLRTKVLPTYLYLIYSSLHFTADEREKMCMSCVFEFKKSFITIFETTSQAFFVDCLTDSEMHSPVDTL